MPSGFTAAGRIISLLKVRVKLKRILINALSGIGDALMFTPSIVELRKAFPDYQIDALVMYGGVKDLYERIPEISRVIYFDFLNSNPFKALFFVLRLRKKYWASFNVYPSNRKEYNLINFLIGAPKRLAVEYLRMDRRNLGFLNNLRIKEDDSLHNVEENLRMTGLLTNREIDSPAPLKFPLTAEDEKFAEGFFEENGLKNSLIIGFHPGCSTLKNHINRRWPPMYFSSLAKKILREFEDSKILIFGGKDENSLKNKIHADIASERALIVNTDSLAETAALIKRCNYFVTNDSGLMHIAAAMNVKVIPILGPTNSNYIYPWEAEYSIASLRLECSPCFYYSPRPLSCSRGDIKFKCMKDLKPAVVFEVFKEFAGKSGS